MMNFAKLGPLAVLLCALLSTLGIAAPAHAQGGGGDITIPRSEPPSKKPAEDRPKASPAPVDLRPKFKVGQTISLTLDSTSTSTAPPGLLGQPDDADPSTRPASQPAKKPGTNPASKPAPAAKSDKSEPTNDVRTTLGLTLHVLRIDEQGNAEVDLVYDRIALTSKSPAGDFTFDSAKPAPKKTGDPLKDMADPIESALRPLVGTHQKLTFDRNGNITKAEGGEAFSSLFALAGGGSGGGSLLGPITPGKKTSGQAMVGERWSVDDTLSVGPLGETAVRTGYQLTSAGSGKANVSFEGKLVPTSAQPSDSGFTLRECSHRGSYVWNTEVGFLDSMQDEQDLTLEIKSGSKTALMKSHQTTKVTRTK